MSLSVVTGPADEPLTLAEVSNFRRVDDSGEDTDLTMMIQSARETVENFTRRRLMSQTLEQTWDWGFPSVLCLDVLPVQSITSITYIDTAGATQTVATSVYTADLNSTPVRIFEAFDQVWPSTRDIRNAVTVRFLAGYVDVDSVPAPLKSAMQLIVGDRYEFREDMGGPGSVTAFPMGSESLMWPFVWN